MKRIALTLIAFGFVLSSSAQRFGYVDSNYILENIPEYQNKQKELNEISVQWQDEIEKMYAEIDRMYKDFQAEQILLTDDMKRKREDQIIEKEKEAKEKQKQRFGFQGDLFQKRQQFTKPIQDKVYAAIKEIADARGYAVIFDKAGTLTMLYTSEKYDLSEDILDALGHSSKTTKTDK
ncbi:MAG: OmpH family outer membrane protein [Flavobacteriales bacterium]|nr:OmpH family outer membrane protein [Flavobacteriales bacterium]